MKFVLTIEDFKIPNSENFTHESTSWRVARDREMSDLIINIENSINNKKELILDYEFDNNEVLYAQSKINFSNGKDNGWDRPIAITKDIEGFKFSNILILTPEVYIENNSNLDVNKKEITVSSSEFKLYSGIGNHKSTSWYIENSFGEIIWKRERDEENLTNITINTESLKDNKIYIAKVVYHTDTNGKSNYGKKEFMIDFNKDKIFDLIRDSDYLYSDKLNCFDVVIYKNNIVSISYSVKQYKNKELTNIYNGVLDETMVLKIDNIETNKRYIIELIATDINDIKYVSKYEFESKDYDKNKYTEANEMLGNNIISLDNQLFSEFKNKFNSVSLGNYIGYVNIVDSKLEVFNLINKDLVLEKSFDIELKFNNWEPIKNKDVYLRYLNNEILVISYLVETNVGIKQAILTYRFCYKTLELDELNRIIDMDSNPINYKFNFTTYDTWDIIYATKNAVTDNLDIKLINTKDNDITTIKSLSLDIDEHEMDFGLVISFNKDKILIFTAIGTMYIFNIKTKKYEYLYRIETDNLDINEYGVINDIQTLETKYNDKFLYMLNPNNDNKDTLYNIDNENGNLIDNIVFLNERRLGSLISLNNNSVICIDNVPIKSTNELKTKQIF